MVRYKKSGPLPKLFWLSALVLFLAVGVVLVQQRQIINSDAASSTCYKDCMAQGNGSGECNVICKKGGSSANNGMECWNSNDCGGGKECRGGVCKERIDSPSAGGGSAGGVEKPRETPRPTPTATPVAGNCYSDCMNKGNGSGECNTICKIALGTTPPVVKTYQGCKPDGKVNYCVTRGGFGQKYCSGGRWTNCVSKGFCTTAGNYSNCSCPKTSEYAGEKCNRFCRPLLWSNPDLNVDGQRNLGTWTECHPEEPPMYRIDNYSYVCKSDPDCNRLFGNLSNFCDQQTGLCAYFTFGQ